MSEMTRGNTRKGSSMTRKEFERWYVKKFLRSCNRYNCFYRSFWEGARQALGEKVLMKDREFERPFYDRFLKRTDRHKIFKRCYLAYRYGFRRAQSGFVL